MSAGSAPAAAYGFQIAGAPSTPWLALPGTGHWPVMRLERDGDGAPAMDVAALRARVPAGARVDDIVHPMLASLATLVALEWGLDGLHAGALCGAGGVWAVFGAKGAGKSTLLGACANAGVGVFTDDVLVIGGECCFAGPRCVDLRADAARHQSGTEPVRAAEPRWRMTLPPVAAEQQLAGFVHLGWGEHHELVRLQPSDALARLAAAYRTGGFTSDRARLLDFAGRPSYELRRPRGLGQLEATVALLRGELEI